MAVGEKEVNRVLYLGSGFLFFAFLAPAACLGVIVPMLRWVPPPQGFLGGLDRLFWCFFVMVGGDGDRGRSVAGRGPAPFCVSMRAP